MIMKVGKLHFQIQRSIRNELQNNKKKEEKDIVNFPQWPETRRVKAYIFSENVILKPTMQY